MSGQNKFSKINCGSCVRLYALAFKLPLEYIGLSFKIQALQVFWLILGTHKSFIKNVRAKLGTFFIQTMF